jgi:peptidyl-tRNA hydrolase
MSPAKLAAQVGHAVTNLILKSTDEAPLINIKG